jgi:myo-inositol 2-dehydrogenase/D-chiro-inositol 1-dehydrogenase
VTLSVGVIGTGSIGTDHVDRLTRQIAGSRVAAVFDVATGRAEQVAAGAGAVACRRAVDVVARADVDAVLIASPGDMHAEQVLQCLAAGKPVLCEKPLASTAADGLRVVAAEAALGRRLVQVGFMRRYDVGYRGLKAVLDAGEVGEPLLLHCVHRNASAPPGFTSELSLTDSVVHEIDAARWLLGEELVAATVVAVRPSPVVGAGIRDPQLVLLETASGVVVEVESFLNSRYGYEVRCEVVGSAGTVSLDTPVTGAVTTRGRRSVPVPPDWRVRFADAYRQELQDWVDGLAAGQVGGPSSWDGYAAAAAAEACVASLHSGSRSEVELAPRPALYEPVPARS